MKKIKIILITLLYIGLILINTNVYAKTGKATNETTRLRKEASTDSSIVALISQDEEVEIIGEEGDWYKVTYSTYTGYVRKDMLSVESDENSNTTQNNEITNTTTEEEQQNQNTSDNTNQEENQNEVSVKSIENTDILHIGYSGKLTSSLEIKILPLINSSVIATVNENTEFTITDIINKWCYIETENVSGWVLLSKVKSEISSDTTTPSQEEKTSEDKEDENTKTSETSKKEENTTITKYVSVETLNVRESDDNNAKIVNQLALNTQVIVVEVVDSTWSKISAKGITGYVASKYLSDTKTDISSRSEIVVRESSNTELASNSEETSETTTDSNSSTSSQIGTTGTDIVDYAKQYMGYKYVSGGASPSTGFDCSGFTYYVYKHFGTTISRTSTAQASNGVDVSKSNLQAGDLVIFNNSSNSSIGHVGIYIGGDTFIHAANASKGVTTTSLSDSYYSARYVAARRIIN